jgi:RNA polymerase sigma factor (sigma-70 family)
MPQGDIIQMEGAPTEAAVAALRPAVYRFLLKATGNPAEADDLTQDTLTQALKALPAFRGECRLSTWLFGIGLNIMRNHVRLARHRLEVSDPALAEIPGGEDPATHLLRSREHLMLRQAIDRLPAEFREAILLVSIEELSYEEAAAALDIPIGTIRSRMSRGRALLREALTEQGYATRPAWPAQRSVS